MPRRIALTRRSGAHARVALLGALALLASGCQWYSMTPKERHSMPATAARALNTLALGEPRDNALDCAKKECNHWYRLDVPTAGVLEVDVETRAEDDRPVARLLVRQLGRPPLGQTMGGASKTLTVRSPVHEGLYMVLVQAGGARLPYTVTATLDPDSS